jgi:hypothetical protein
MTSQLMVALVLALSAQSVESNMTDQACGSNDAPVAAASGLVISGHCESSGLSRVLRLSLTTSDPERLRGRLEELSLGFCGEIVDAGAPAGWEVSVLRKSTVFGQPAEVEWTRTAAVGNADDAASGARIQGFLVLLKSGWRRAIAFGVRWQKSVEASGSPHDCGEWSR